jgi:uncharacterized protein (TIGR02145 family)
MNLLIRHGRALLLVATVAVGAILSAGCGDDNGTNSGGGSYGSVTIGGKKWMKKNLNVEAAGSWCYESNSANCDKYGRLYTWEAAKSACLLAGSGWRLPTYEDWNALRSAVGGLSIAGKNLKAKNGWEWNTVNNISGNGTDDFGFSALPGGYRYEDGRFDDAGYYGYWWTTTEDSNGAYIWRMYYLNDYVSEHFGAKNGGFSVRCVKD